MIGRFTFRCGFDGSQLDVELDDNLTWTCAAAPDVARFLFEFASGSLQGRSVC